MIVHLFPYSFFVNNFIEFLTSNFDSQDHKVVVYREGDYATELVDSPVVIRYTGKRDLIKLIKLLKVADRIVIHSLGIEFEMLILLFLNGKLCKKSVWVIWGNDLYCKTASRTKLIEKIVEHMRASVIGSLAYIGCLVKGDYDLAKEWYLTQAVMLRVNYWEPLRKPIADSASDVGTGREGIPLKIIVGNSGTPSNRHLEVLERLKRWKDEDIHIFVPLSYGDKEYISKVAREYKAELGDRVTILDKLMPIDEYLTFLSTMDIAIFDNDRQQALGNIFCLMYMGKTIYLKKGTSMWDELVETAGACIIDSKEIDGESFLTRSLSKEEIRINRDVSKKLHFEQKELSDGWAKAFGLR